GDFALAPDRATHCEAVHAWEHQVEDDEVRFGRAEDLESLFSVLRGGDLVAFAPQGVPDRVPQIGLVVGEQDAAHTGWKPATGNVKENVAPRPGPGLAARITPPCASTMCLAIESPRPLPPSARDWSLL